MTFGRKIVTAAAAVLAVASMAAAAWAASPKPPKAPPVYSPEVNMCRASCGEAWVEARSCPAAAATCLRRADRAYRQCLPDCEAGTAPRSGAFAYLKPKKPAVTPRPAAKPEDNGPDSTADAPWIDARAHWITLPARTPAPLPAVFALPAKAYDYAAFTDDIRPFLLQSEGLLKVELTVARGLAGVSLAKPDGSALVSREAVLKPAPGVQAVYFRIGPDTPPAALLLRNADEGGAPGGVTVRAVTFARSKFLPADAAERLGALK